MKSWHEFVFWTNQNFGGLENMSSFRKCNHAGPNIEPTETEIKDTFVSSAKQ
jgi:hypothetical protein